MPNQIRIPDELVKAAARDECIAFLGAGASRDAGAPLWSELVDEFIDFAVERGGIPADEAKRLAKARDRTGPEVTAAIVRRRIEEADFRTFMDGHFRRDLWKPTAVHNAVVRGPFRAIFTTNYDCLIERAYEQAYPKRERPPVVTWQNIDDALRAEKEGEFYVTKLHGCVEHPGSTILTKGDFVRLQREPGYMEFLTAHLVLRSLLFVGYSISDDDTRVLLELLQERFPGRGTRHFALVRAADTDPLTLDQLSREFGVTFIPYKQDADVPSFLRRLARKTRETPSHATARVLRLLEPDDRLRFLAKALAWDLVDGVREGRIRAYEFCERRGNTVTRIALSDLKGGLTKRRATHAAAMACRFGCNETFVLVDRPPSAAIRDLVAKARAICLEPRGLIMRGVDLLEYASKLSADTELASLDRRYVQPAYDVKIGESASGRNLDDYALRWLHDPERRELWILGDFGTGKTWFSRHFARLLATAKLKGKCSLPTPIVVPLRLFTDIADVHTFIQRCLAKRGIGLAAGDATLDWVMDAGMLMLIFDGADECPDALFHARQVASAGIKVIITCRTHYFDSLGQCQRELGIPRTPLNVVELRGFDDDALEEAIRARYPSDSNQRLTTLAHWPELWDMAHRPLFLDMILRDLNKVTMRVAPTVADVYDRYINSVLRRRSAPSVRRILRAVLEQLAREGQERERRAAQFSRDEMRAAIEAVHVKKRAFAVYEALHAGSLLVRNPQDFFEFGHLSIQEYLAASSLAEDENEAVNTLSRHVADEDWREVCWFYASIQGAGALPVVDACLGRSATDPSCLFLAARMLQAARQQEDCRAGKVCEALINLCREKHTHKGKGPDKKTKSWFAFTERVYDSLRRLGSAATRTLRRRMKARDPLVRRRALLTLFHVFEREALPEVAPYLDPEKEKDEHVRWHAAEGLSEVAVPDDLKTLLEYAAKADDQNDRYMIVRGNILWACAKCRCEFPSELPPFDVTLVDRLQETVARQRVGFDVKSHGVLLLARCAISLGVPKRRKDDIGQLLSGLLEKRTVWRGYVARALGELGWEGGCVALCRYIETSRDDEIWLRYAVDAIVKRLARPISGHIAAIEKAATALPDSLRHLRSRLEASAAQLRADSRTRRAKNRPSMADDLAETQQCKSPPV